MERRVCWKGEERHGFGDSKSGLDNPSFNIPGNALDEIRTNKEILNGVGCHSGNDAQVLYSVSEETSIALEPRKPDRADLD